MMNSIRQGKIDIAKGLGILCVVYGHTFGFDEVGNFIYLFHMPLFFFLSGVFLRMRKGVVVEVCNKAKRLLIPFVVFTVVAYPIQIYKDIKGIEMLSGGGQILASHFRASICNRPLWFLIELFLAYIILILLTRIQNEKCRLSIGFIIMACGYFLSAYYHDVIPRTRTLLCFGFLWMGYVLGNRIREFKGNIWLTLISVIILIVGMFVHDIPNIMQYQIPTNPLLFYGCAFAGIYVVLVASCKLELHNRISAPLQYIGRNTLYIFGLHWPLIGCINYWLRDIPSFATNSFLFVFVIVFSLLCGRILYKLMPTILPEIK